MVYIFLNNRNNKSTDSLPVSIIQRIDTPNIPTTNKIVTQEYISGNNNNYDDISNEKKYSKITFILISKLFLHKERT